MFYTLKTYELPKNNLKARQLPNMPKADEGKYTSYIIAEESKLKCKKCKFNSLKNV